MSNNKLVSVVIPTHNRADVLPRAIDSVLSQTYTQFEILVVSDGSSDNTESVVKSYMEKDNRVKFISYSPAKGGNFARNTGIDSALGDYIAFLDDDDEWFEEKLQSQVDVMENNQNCGFVFTGILSVNIFGKQTLTYTSIPILKTNYKKEILISNFLGTTSTVLIRKELLQQEKFDEAMPAIQDYDLWVRLCQITEVEIVSRALVRYYSVFTSKNSNQISNSIEKYNDATQKMLNKYKNHYALLSETERMEKRANILRGKANRYMRSNARKEARKVYLELYQLTKRGKFICYYLGGFLPYKYFVAIRCLKK